MNIRPNAVRKSDGWAPALDYENGGRVIGMQRHWSMEQALRESQEMIQCMTDYPESFQSNHPNPHELIDLGQRSSESTDRH